VSEPTAPGDLPGGHLRVSDVERQAVVDRLSKATGEGLLNLEEFADAAGAAYAAVTRAELDAVTRDLHLPVLLPPPTVPPPQARSVPAASPAASPAESPAATPAPAGEPVDWVVAVMGGEQRRGRWRARRRTTAVAVMGGVDLDLREAVLEGDVIEITAWAVMGGVDIIVPEGVAVEFTGFVLMGGRTNRVKHVESTPDTPVIRVKGYGMWGGVTVRSRRPRQPGAEAGGSRPRRGSHRFVPPLPPVPPIPPLVPHAHRHRHHHEEPVSAPPPPPPPATGSLVTVVCTDIVGSTRYADTLGDQRWRTVLLDHNALVRQHLARHGGTEVKNTGDGFLMTFTGARSALQFAVGLQDGLTTWRETHPETPLEVRIGVHAGEVETDGHDLVGRNVTIACRLCDTAAPGEVLASAVVADLADSASDLEFGDAREHNLAGIERPLVARAARRR
jgi:class 3 adenylate cyclase